MNMHRNIIVIGNGFDLAHGLPTKYYDFLKWIQVMDEVYKINDEQYLDYIAWKGINEQIKKMVISNFNNTSLRMEYTRLRNKNSWISYFISKCEKLKNEGKETWIDFESEISNVIQLIDKTNLEYAILNDTFEDLFINETCETNKNMTKTKDRLYNDLNSLIRLLEIYFAEYVEKIEISKKSPDINEHFCERHKNELGDTERASLNYVISFNYTHTYEKQYVKMSTLKDDERIFEPINNPAFKEYISFIHGEAKVSNNVDTNNMVLGIDEYLQDDDKNTKLDFVGFKKYFQRIYKGTDIKYKEWVSKINDDDMKYQRDWARINSYTTNYNERFKHEIYFYGHSLDVTDKDIIRDLILHDTVHTTIYYYPEYENDKKDLFSKISNLVKIIGQDELTKRINEKSIEFRKQQEMISIEQEK